MRLSIWRRLTTRRSRGDKWGAFAVALAMAFALAAPGVPAEAGGRSGRLHVTEFATYTEGPCTDDICGTGSTIGPDGDLYVTDSDEGRVRRIDLPSGTVTTYIDGLPKAIPGVIGGGVADIVFRGRTAYLLVTGVGEFFGGSAVEGIYRVDRIRGQRRATPIVDLGTWSRQNPPASPSWVVPTGFTYAMEKYRNGFLVTDAHHNRVLRVRLGGRISVVHDFAADVVPTGLERVGRDILVGLAGPVPHTPSTGKVVAVGRNGSVEPVAAGAPLLVDVEVGSRRALYALAQGYWPYGDEPGKEGFPAAPNTGLLMRADDQGQFRAVVSGLDRPTTFELVGDTAYVVTLTGKVLRVTGLNK